MPLSALRKQLLASAQALCSDFARGADTETLLEHFVSGSSATAGTPEAHEHGLPQLAPFLGRFTGHDGIRKYFGLLQQYLTFEDMKFSEWVVDAENMRVSVKGNAVFTWKETKKQWPETFSYTLDFVNEGHHVKLLRYQVWADTGAGETPFAGTRVSR